MSDSTESAADIPAGTPADAPANATASNLFDLRTIIAVLFGGYGVALLVVGLTHTTDADLVKTAGIHLNTWTGAAMLVVAMGFLAWARLRPLRPPTLEQLAQHSGGPPGH